MTQSFGVASKTSEGTDAEQACKAPFSDFAGVPTGGKSATTTADR